VVIAIRVGLTPPRPFRYLTDVNRSWLRIAHRGASGTAPEHSRPAFECALAVGVDMIELDVQLSRDGELVVIHDHDLQRTTTGSGLVRDQDFQAIVALDAGSWFAPRFAGERVLNLGQVIQLVSGRARLNVEIKSAAADWHELAARLVALLRSRELLEATVLSSFDPGALQAVRAQADEAHLGLVWSRTELADAWRLAGDLHAVSIHPDWTLVSTDFVEDAHQRGFQVLTWTVNDVDVMRDLLRRGVDGIMSDFPERFADITGS
jgi:glycerophosphoryl diester phosphodiesterase